MTYDVHLEIFEGPLDLLLHLIKKDDLEIAEIPIAQITSEYLGYLELMKEMNLDIAGEFLVMASTLMQIKARTLLPAPETGQEDGPDPLEELKARLMEYQRFKEVSQVLARKEYESSLVYFRPTPVFAKDDFVLEVSLFDLMSSFREVLQELPTGVKEIVYKEIPIEQRIREILDLFEGKSHLNFKDILLQWATRRDIIVSFLAVLELIRLKQIVARQAKLFDEVRVYRIDGFMGDGLFDPSVRDAEGQEAAQAPEAPAEEQSISEEGRAAALKFIKEGAVREPVPERPAGDAAASAAHEPVPDNPGDTTTKS